MACSNKVPPKFENELDCENWKKDIDIWCELTELAEEKRALAVHLSLSGKTRMALSELTLSELKNKDGIKKLIEKLDELFLPDQGRRQLTAFNDLYNLRRKEEDMTDFISEFEHKYYRYKQEEMDLPESVMAFMLLASCDLSGKDTQLVMSAISKVAYDNVKNTLKRVFGQNVCCQRGVECGAEMATNLPVTVKSEAVFYGDGTSGSQPEMYVAHRGARSRRRPLHRGTFSNRGGGGRGSKYSGAQYNWKLNSVGIDGQVSKCVVCDSRFHWARDCPHSYENSEEKDKNFLKGEDEEMVHLSMFVGYTSASSKDSKLAKLVEKSRECAVIDTECSATVCG